MIHLKSGSKYHNKGTVIDEIYFDSHKEALRYNELKYLQLAGEISQLQVHPVFRLLDHFRDPYSGECQKMINYTGDFMYREKDNHVVVEDVKASKEMQTEAFRIKWKWVKHLNPTIEFRLITKVRGAK